MLLRMSNVDLTPFGFTRTESLVYVTLLRLGPSTGYAVAQGARVARANAYGALAGLVTRGAASHVPGGGRPMRYRPTDPGALLAHLAALQGGALDRLAHALRDASQPREPATKEVAGARAIANLILQLVARADDGFPPPPPLPPGAEGIVTGVAPAGTPTLLVVDEAQAVMTSGAGEQISGLWSSHPLIVALARRALQ